MFSKHLVTHAQQFSEGFRNLIQTYNMLCLYFRIIKSEKTFSNECRSLNCIKAFYRESEFDGISILLHLYQKKRLKYGGKS